MFRRVDDVFFDVDDMDQAAAFNRDTLGLVVKCQTADGTELYSGSVTMALRRFGSDPEGRPELGVGAGAAIVFEVDDLETAGEELEGKGVSFLGCVFEYGSVKLAAFEDLNGNVPRIYEHVR